MTHRNVRRVPRSSKSKKSGSNSFSDDVVAASAMESPTTVAVRLDLVGLSPAPECKTRHQYPEKTRYEMRQSMRVRTKSQERKRRSSTPHVSNRPRSSSRTKSQERKRRSSTPHVSNRRGSSQPRSSNRTKSLERKRRSRGLSQQPRSSNNAARSRKNDSFLSWDDLERLREAGKRNARPEVSAGKRPRKSAVSNWFQPATGKHYDPCK